MDGCCLITGERPEALSGHDLEGFFDRPVPVKPGADTSTGKPDLFDGLRKGHLLAAIDDESVVALVASLHLRRCPAAVLPFVRVVVVDPLKRVPGAGAGTHVGEEVLERLAPAGADRDAAPAVAG
jgi:hypothetical protein